MLVLLKFSSITPSWNVTHGFAKNVAVHCFLEQGSFGKENREQCVYKQEKVQVVNQEDEEFNFSHKNTPLQGKKHEGEQLMFKL